MSQVQELSHELVQTSSILLYMPLTIYLMRYKCRLACVIVLWLSYKQFGWDQRGLLTHILQGYFLCAGTIVCNINWCQNTAKCNTAWNVCMILVIHCLTHWGRVTHICVSKLTIIGSDNGLSPGRRQAIIWTNAGILLTVPLRANFSEILIEILTFSFKKMRFKV